MAAVLYATVSDLRAWLSGTDGGTGTAAKLTDYQLTLALTWASNQVSIAAGNIFDSSIPQAVPPPAFQTLTLDLAAYIATRNYLKHKVMANDHPMVIAYKDAKQMLADARAGKVRLDPVVVGGIGDEVGVVINRIPNIFTFENSGTKYNPVDTQLEADLATYSSFGPNWLEETGGPGPEYQG